jgi:hypothetical protein
MREHCYILINGFCMNAHESLTKRCSGKRPLVLSSVLAVIPNLRLRSSSAMGVSADLER